MTNPRVAESHERRKLMDVMTRDALRTAVINKLLTDFPKAQKVAGGVAFMSETLDEETGLYFPVEIKVSVKNTQATARSEAYDFEKAVADFAAKPGRRVADPAKKAQKDAEKAAAAAKKSANLAVLRDWIAANDVVEMTATDIHTAIPEFKSLQVMNVGTLLKVLAEDGVVNVTLNDKRKKLYTKI